MVFLFYFRLHLFQHIAFSDVKCSHLKTVFRKITDFRSLTITQKCCPKSIFPYLDYTENVKLLTFKFLVWWFWWGLVSVGGGGV